MHKALTIILLLLIVGVSACKRGQTPPEPASDLTAAEYNVFSAYIAGKFTGKRKQPTSNDVSRLVVFNMTGSDERHRLRDENGQFLPWQKTAEFLRGKDPALQRTTLDSFLKANSQQAFLHPSLRLPIDYELIDVAKETSIFRKGGGDWVTYFQQYPGSNGILTLSRVGFNADGTEAFFYFENICGGLCGGGSYVVMERRDSRWMIGTEIEMWIS